jgi:hypothetical protein
MDFKIYTMCIARSVAIFPFNVGEYRASQSVGDFLTIVEWPDHIPARVLYAQPLRQWTPFNLYLMSMPPSFAIPPFDVTEVIAMIQITRNIAINCWTQSTVYHGSYTSISFF